MPHSFSAMRTASSVMRSILWDKISRMLITLAGMVLIFCKLRADLMTCSSGAGVTMSAEEATPRAASAPAICLVLGSVKSNLSSTLSSPSPALAERTHLMARRRIFLGISCR